MNKRLVLLSLFVLGSTLLAPCSFSSVIPPSKGVLNKSGTTVWYKGSLLPIEGRGYPETEGTYARLPNRFRPRMRAVLWGLSQQSAGLSCRFKSDSSCFWISWSLTGAPNRMTHMAGTGASGMDIYRWTERGWRYLSSSRGIKKAGNVLFVKGVEPGTPLMVNFPLYNGVSSFHIGIPKGKKLETLEPRTGGIVRPVVFYGTSITQGCSASRPGMAYPAIIGRTLDIPVVNLGFSGCAHMEPILAEILSGIKASAYVLDCHWNMTEQTIGTMLEPFVRKLHTDHPDCPILIVEDSTVFGVYPTPKGIVSRKIYDKLKAEDPQGWKNLFYLSSRELIPDNGEASVDGIHLTDYGMMNQAEVLSKKLKTILKVKPGL